MANSAFDVNNGATVTSVGVSSSTGLQIGSTPVTTSGTITVDLPASVSGRNMIVNGDFQVWQRGAGGSAVIAVPASTTAYTADRWQLSTNANQACTVTQSAGVTSGSYLCKVQRNNGQTGVSGINFATSLTRSMCIGAAGNKLTVSFKAKVGANFSGAGNALGVTVVSGTGSSDISFFSGFTGANNELVQSNTLTTSLQSFSGTTSILAANVTQLAVIFNYTPTGTAGADDSFYVTDVQLEISPSATAFDRKNFQEQLVICQAFYEKSFDYSTAPAQNAGINGASQHSQIVAANTGQNSDMIWYKVTKRATPYSITFYNPSATNAEARNIISNTDCTATTLYQNNQANFCYSYTTPAATLVAYITALQWTCEAELL